MIISNSHGWVRLGGGGIYHGCPLMITFPGLARIDPPPK